MTATPPPGPPANGRPRAPYEAPRIEQTAEFETLAASCAKQPGGGRTPSKCGGNPRIS